MTTTNDGGIHPMVMKAARKANEIASRECNTCPEDGWKLYWSEYIRDAHEMLTECGALESLQALEAYENAQTGYDSDAAHMLAYNALTKVYGSAAG
jgi:hypothetical protein